MYQVLTKVDKYGAPINGYKMTAVLVSILIIVPALGMGDTNALYNWLLDLNAAVMPLRYLWVFLAYIALTKMSDKFSSSYTFVKNRKVAKGIWYMVFCIYSFCMYHGNVSKGCRNIFTTVDNYGCNKFCNTIRVNRFRVNSS